MPPYDAARYKINPREELVVLRMETDMWVEQTATEILSAADASTLSRRKDAVASLLKQRFLNFVTAFWKMPRHLPERAKT